MTSCMVLRFVIEAVIALVLSWSGRVSDTEAQFQRYKSIFFPNIVKSYLFKMKQSR
jgi:hypothetical protein